MASAKFIAKCAEQSLNPYIRVVLDMEYMPFMDDFVDITSDVLKISEIIRDDTLSSKEVTVTVSNTDNDYDEFLSIQDALTTKCTIYLTHQTFTTYTASTISFHENTPNKDTIEDSANGLGSFVAGQIITVSGTAINPGTYEIYSATAGVITLVAVDDLTNESAGPSVTIETETITLFTGYAEKAEADYTNMTMTLSFKSSLAACMEKLVADITGNRIDTVTYNYYTPLGVKINEMIISEIVWDILTKYADLDDDTSDSNQHIDYNSWVDWAVTVDNGGYAIYDIGIVSHGETVGNVISQIARLTQSQIWESGEGRIKFKSSTQSVAGQTYTTAKILSANWNVSLDGRINDQYVSFGYNPAFDLWLSDTTTSIYHDIHDYGPTIEPYNKQTDYEEDRLAFHNDGNSAQNMTDEKLLITAPPIRRWEFQTQLTGFLEDIGNEIIISNLYVTAPYDSIEIHIEKIVYNTENFTTNIYGYYIWGVGELV